MAIVRANVQPFALEPASAGSAWSRAALGVAAPAIERILGLATLARMYDEAVGRSLVQDFPERALRHLNISWRAHGAPIASIPADGPLIVVANHPFGAADGLVLLALMRQIRPDVRLLGNYLLQRIPELHDLLIAVDPFSGPHARDVNRRMVRRAVDWTRRGGAVIVFPAGEVAHVRSEDGRLLDGPWKRGVATLARASQAAVLPIHFSGRNSRWFELAGRAHPRLRTALLPRELLRMRGREVTATIGTVIPPARLAACDSAAGLTNYLRARTSALERPPDRSAAATVRRLEPLIEPVPDADMARELASLPASRRLVRFQDFEVVYVTASEAPSLLREIGRLREETFRAAGEGTGRGVDLDVFDAAYWHLVLWHTRRREVVGAYRLGATDRRTGSIGPRGLYTRTLFRYGRRFLRDLGPALELGRSFIRREYQREHSALMLLWQGIGRFVVQHPRYRKLFGPVSISAGYGPVTRDLLADGLGRLARPTPLTRLVQPKRPHRRYATRDPLDLARDLGSLQRLVMELEPDGKAMPVLLRQYLKLNASVLGTNVDPAFSGVLDALVVVDLDALDRPVLARYLGAEGAASFLAASVGHERGTAGGEMREAQPNQA